MRRMFLGLALVVCFATLPAFGGMLFVATLEGAQEVPPNLSPATGSAMVMLNDTEDMVMVSVHFSGLTAPETGKHIHGPAMPGVNAGVLLALPAGEFDHFMAAASAELVAHLKAGHTYVNIHSQNYPGGEIRGQLQAVPEPGAVALMLTGVTGLLVFRRRRK